MAAQAEIGNAVKTATGTLRSWGSQSWLQPAFQPAGRYCTSSEEPAEKPAAVKIACPTHD
jgi:hypothetical protein